MKSCPACKRVEPDDTLTFCRADGTPLVSDSGPVSAEAGTAKFGFAPVSSELKTSVLPQHVTDAGRTTGSTTVLDRPEATSRTHELDKPKRSRAWVLAVSTIVVIALVVSAYLYLSRAKNTATKNS